MAYTDDDVTTWTTAASNLHEHTVSAELARDAWHAAAMLMSGSGLLDAVGAGYSATSRDLGFLFGRRVL
jgi:hypothetical protein